VIADDRVAELFSEDFIRLRDAFREWQPKTAILRDIKRKLQPIQRLSSTMLSKHVDSMSKLWSSCDGTPSRSVTGPCFFPVRSHTSLLDFHTPHNTWNTIPHCISFIYASPHSWSLKYKFYWAQCDAGKSKFRSPQHGSSSLRILHTQWRTEAMMLVFRTGMIILHQSENVEYERCCVLIKLSELHNCRSSFV